MDYDKEAHTEAVASDRPQLAIENDDVALEGGLGEGAVDEEGLGSDGGGGGGGGAGGGKDGSSLVKRRRSRSEEEDEEYGSSDDVEALESPEEGMNAEVKLEFEVWR